MGHINHENFIMTWIYGLVFNISFLQDYLPLQVLLVEKNLEHFQMFLVFLGPIAPINKFTQIISRHSLRIEFQITIHTIYILTISMGMIATIFQIFSQNDAMSPRWSLVFKWMILSIVLSNWQEWLIGIKLFLNAPTSGTGMSP